MYFYIRISLSEDQPQCCLMLISFNISGNKTDAHDHRHLRRQGITHVFNCAAYRDYSRDDFFISPYEGTTSGVTHYEEIEAQDDEAYPILTHFCQAKRFIDHAKERGGKALVHCEMGVNRSGALCVAYMMIHENNTLFRILREVKLQRPLLLVNEGFQKQLLDFATDRGLLNT